MNKMIDLNWKIFYYRENCRITDSKLEKIAKYYKELFVKGTWNYWYENIFHYFAITVKYIKQEREF